MPVNSWDTVAEALSLRRGGAGNGLGETCAAAGVEHTARYSSTRAIDARQAGCMAVPFPCPRNGPIRAPNRPADRTCYAGRTVNVTFCVTDLFVVLSVTLISRR